MKSNDEPGLAGERSTMRLFMCLDESETFTEARYLTIGVKKEENTLWDQY